MKRLTFFAPLFLASSAHAAIITLTNAGFQTDIGQVNTVVTGWTAVDGQGTNGPPSNYFADGLAGGASNRMALIKSDGSNYIQQAITTSDAGAVDAGTFGNYTVNFDYGYRRESTTSGDLTIRVALWNITDAVQLAFQDFIITDPGVGANSIAAQVASLNYANAGLSGKSLALRIVNTSSDLAGNSWYRTAMVDNFAMTASAVPEPATYGVAMASAAAALAVVRRRRR